MGSRVLRERRILITGASSGIGRALALRLAQLQTRLMLTARRAPLLQELAEEAERQGAESVVTVAGDVAEADFRTKLLQRVQSTWGSLDVLVNNAGTSAHGRFAGSEESLLRQIMEVNFFAATEMTRGALPLLRQGRDPLLVNISSILGHRGLPHNSEYCASKFALRGWSEAIRPEMLREGIEVLLVSPGTTDTEFFEHLLAREENLPWATQRGVPPEQVARQIVRAMKRRKREIYPNWRGRMLVWVNRIAPGAMDRIMNRYG